MSSVRRRLARGLPGFTTMLDEERGTYSPPTEDHLSYETRRTAPRDSAPLTLIISGIFLVLLLIAVVIFVNSGMNTHGKVPPEVGATLGNLKDTTQVQDAQPLSDQDLANPDGDSGAAKFAPGTESPTVRDTPQQTVDQAPPPAAPITGPLPSQAGNPALSASSSASASPVAVVKPAVSASSSLVASAAAPASGGAGSVVQIGAFTSPEIATTEYNKLVSSYGLFLSGTGKRVEKVDTSNGTVYRTSFTGFATAEKAHAFCSALKAAGHDCFVK